MTPIAKATHQLDGATRNHVQYKLRGANANEKTLPRHNAERKTGRAIRPDNHGTRFSPPVSRSPATWKTIHKESPRSLTTSTRSTFKAVLAELYIGESFATVSAISVKLSRRPDRTPGEAGVPFLLHSRSRDASTLAHLVFLLFSTFSPVPGSLCGTYVTTRRHASAATLHSERRGYVQCSTLRGKREAALIISARIPTAGRATERPCCYA